MRCTLILPALAGLICANPLTAATVSFDPPEYFIDPNLHVASVDFEVAISTDTGASIQGFGALFTSDTLSVQEFAYSQDVIDGCPFCPWPYPWPVPGPYPFNGVAITGFSLSGWASPLRAGTLNVGVYRLPPGTYSVFVDPALDGGFSNVNGEPLNGSATIHIIPEPATIGLLGLGFLCFFVRERRRSSWRGGSDRSVDRVN